MCSAGEEGLNLRLGQRSMLAAGVVVVARHAPRSCKGDADDDGSEHRARAQVGTDEVASHSTVVFSPHEKTRLGFRLAQRSDSPW